MFSSSIVPKSAKNILNLLFPMPLVSQIIDDCHGGGSLRSPGGAPRSPSDVVHNTLRSPGGDLRSSSDEPVYNNLRSPGGTIRSSSNTVYNTPNNRPNDTPLRSPGGAFRSPSDAVHNNNLFTSPGGGTVYTVNNSSVDGDVNNNSNPVVNNPVNNSSPGGDVNNLNPGDIVNNTVYNPSPGGSVHNSSPGDDNVNNNVYNSSPGGTVNNSSPGDDNVNNNVNNSSPGGSVNKSSPGDDNVNTVNISSPGGDVHTSSPGGVVNISSPSGEYTSSPGGESPKSPGDGDRSNPGGQESLKSDISSPGGESLLISSLGVAPPRSPKRPLEDDPESSSGAIDKKLKSSHDPAASPPPQSPKRSIDQTENPEESSSKKICTDQNGQVDGAKISMQNTHIYLQDDWVAPEDWVSDLPGLNSKFMSTVYSNMYDSEIGTMVDLEYCDRLDFDEDEILQVRYELIRQLVVLQRRLLPVFEEEEKKTGVLLAGVHCVDMFLSEVEKYPDIDYMTHPPEIYALACFFLAVKYECELDFEKGSYQTIFETLIPEYSSCSADDVIRTEKQIFKVVGSMVFASSADFLTRLCSGRHETDFYDPVTLKLATYLLEYASLCPIYVRTRPSKMAAAVYLLARYMQRLELTDDHYLLSGYTFEEVTPIMSTLIDFIIDNPENSITELWGDETNIINIPRVFAEEELERQQEDQQQQ